MQSGHRKHLKHFNEPGHFHALTFSCYRRLPLLAKDRTRTWLFESLKSACEKHAFRLHAFVFMPEHVHLIVSSDRDPYDISRFLQSVKQPVAIRARMWLLGNDPRWMEKLTITPRTGRSSFRFWQQSGGYDRNIVAEKTLRSTIEYIHANPVRKGLADTTLDWKWSSARWYWTGCQGAIFKIVDESPECPKHRHTFPSEVNVWHTVAGALSTAAGDSEGRNDD